MTVLLHFHDEPKTPADFGENALVKAREEMVSAIHEGNSEHRALLFRRAARWARSACNHFDAEAISAEDIVRGENEMKSRHPGLTRTRGIDG